MKRKAIKFSKYFFKVYNDKGLKYLKGEAGDYTFKYCVRGNDLYRSIDSKYYTENEKKINVPFSGEVDQAAYDCLTFEAE